MKSFKRPNPNVTRIKLTPEEFQHLQGAYAIMALKVQAIQQDAAQKIANVQKNADKVKSDLIKKYKVKGMRPDVNYSFDEETCSLVELK